MAVGVPGHAISWDKKTRLHDVAGGESRRVALHYVHMAAISWACFAEPGA